VDPLANLPPMVAGDPPPSLIVRNLWRGAAFQLPSGQAVAQAIGAAKLPDDRLVVRVQVQDEPKMFQFQPIDAKFVQKTPLWFYVLAEAQANQVPLLGMGQLSEDDLRGAGACSTQLGAVGGRILLEVFHGLLDSDAESVRNHPAAVGWKPLVAKFRMWDVLNFRA
jgi:hypothetical protein